MAHWMIAAGSVLAFLLYLNSLDGEFVYDDRRAILSNPDVIGHTPIKAIFVNDFWGTPLTDPGSHGSYRPLCVATYRLNYAISEFEPWSYHFLNVLLHCTATAMVVITARRILPSYCLRTGTIVTGLAFASHPIHTEAVAGVVGRADLAACNLFLLSFLLYCEHIRLREQRYKKQCRHMQKGNLIQRQIKSSEQLFQLSCHSLVQHIMTNFRKLLKSSRARPMKIMDAREVKTDKVRDKCQFSGAESEVISELLLWLTLAGTFTFAAAATLCKEPAIMVLPICIFYDFLKNFRYKEEHYKYRWLSVCALGTGALALLYWRLQLAGTPTAFAAADNPASREQFFFTRLYTFAYLPAFNFFLLLYPFNLSFDWSMDSIPRITSLSDIRNVITVIFYATILTTTYRMLKMNEFKKPQDNSVKEVKYYRKQNGKIKHKLNYNGKQHNKGQNSYQKKKHHVPRKGNVSSKKLLCPCTGCIYSFSGEHTNKCRAYNNNNIMKYNCSCTCPISSNSRACTMHKSVYRSPKVACLVSMAIMVLPFVPATNLLFYVGFVVAERVLYIPSVGFCLLLGLGAGILTRNWHRDEAKGRLFIFALLVTLCAMSGNTLRRNLVWRDEESLFRSALHINPPKAYGNLGSILITQNRTSEAEAAFKMALKYRPNMADVHYNLGILQQKQRRYSDAIKSFERAIHFRPSMALAFVNLGTSLMADGRLAEAASIFRAGSQADGVRVRDRREHDAARVSALVQLAQLHSQRGHRQEALSAYEDALLILPETDTPVIGWTRNDILSMVENITVQIHKLPSAENSLIATSEATPQDAQTLNTRAQILAKDDNLSMVENITVQIHKLPSAENSLIATSEATPQDAQTLNTRAQILAKDDNLSMVENINVPIHKLPSAENSLIATSEATSQEAQKLIKRAVILAKDASKITKAEMLFNKALTLAPNNLFVRDQFGMFLRSQNRFRESAEQLVAAAELITNDIAHAAVAAIALRDAHRYRAAERWYKRAAKLSPDDADNQSNFGAILHFNGKYEAAVSSYQRALELLPDDVIILLNIKRVQALMSET